MGPLGLIKPGSGDGGMRDGVWGGRLSTDNLPLSSLSSSAGCEFGGTTCLIFTRKRPDEDMD